MTTSVPPMLIERDVQLAALDSAVDAAAAGAGRLLLIGGEAGVGKTTLVAEAARRAAGRTRVLRGVFDNVTTPAALGALVDASEEFAELIEAEAVTRPVLFRRLRASLSATPTTLMLEDVHWADEATLDLMRFLGRRMADAPLLVVATYRTDEVGARHPLAVVLGDLAAEPAVSRLTVEPLSAAGVAELVAAAGAVVDAATVHERTGGNAFFVTEVLAAPGRDVPPTVRDAVLARTMRLSDSARDVLAAAVVLGIPADPLLLAEVAQRSTADVDECVAHGLLVVDRDGLGFRHDLARRAVGETLSPGQMIALHRNALAALRARSFEDDRQLALHAGAAGERVSACEHATRAAVRAARFGAHREAVAQYRAALQFVGGDVAKRAALLADLSYECYLIDEPTESLAARSKAMELAALAGDQPAVGLHQRWMSRLSWFLGRNTDADRYAGRAVRTLEPYGDSHELGMAYSNQAQLAMLAGDIDGAVRWGTRALDLAHRIGDREVEIHALNNVGTSRLHRVYSVEARTQLTRSLDLALADDAHEHAARAYTNLASTAVLGRRFADADTVLRAGIAYCRDRDLDSWGLYMAAQLARALCEHGRHDEASECAQRVLSRPRLAPISVIVAGAAAGLVAARLGTDPGEWLDRAWALAEHTGEAQRLVPVAVAEAEAAWLAGAPAPVAHLDVAWAASTARPVAWEVGEIAYWRAAAGLPATAPVAVPEPFAMMREGRWQAAAQAWRALDCPVWQAISLSREPDLDSARHAFELLTTLQLPVVWAALARDRHAAGLRVPRGPRAARASNPAGLTARELDVLRLLADGLSNPAIAEALFLSARTVEHHVSAVLRKLGRPTRARAVSMAIREGLIDAPS